ncbi:MFS transporter [Mariniblastus fucicola]|uniref:Major Facilitator Superfamily protein n=1 Tax=Mariniblastus fucicola TaxID=980251 RepID=A0A5B9PES9_9BACT|nr:MFS transporter [Mariniblastus fucicola]QEG23680.1 Major Facilitator Superfamily protein [Mariniblastus fucicola]
MSTATSISESEQRPSQLMFWGCWIALITTAFAFISRSFMINTASMWPADFGIDKVQAQELFGAGIWPFAISIILFSLIIDKIGYRIAMVFSFVCYAAYAALALMAYSTVKADGLSGEELLAAQKSGLNLLTIGSIILGLGNGTVEAFINPVVATMYSKEKTKWLNILHAGWPGGLVLGGLITLGLGSYAEADWRLLIYIIAIPAVIYLVMLIGAKFPVSERVAGGATYKEMLAEFGVIGAAIAAFMIFREIGNVFALNDYVVYGLILAAVVAYGIYCQSLGRPLMIFLCLIMMPLATTELGTDGAIGGLMEKPMEALGGNALWVLIYTSLIMMILRFFAGPVIKALTPLGLLAACSALAIVGLYSLSMTTTALAIFAAATLYGVAKTYFWPTMLGVVAEQFPKGGALTLNAIAGIGMLTVGIIGGPMIGKMQEDSAIAALNEQHSAVVSKVEKENTWFLGEYKAVDANSVSELENSEEVQQTIDAAKQGALAKMCVFPFIMLVCYLILIGYFKSKGGYKPATLDGKPAAH